MTSLAEASSVDATQVLRRNSRSFSLAARCLPHRVRNDVAKLYAWCRACDDAVDNAADSVAALAELQCLRQDVLAIADGTEAELAHPASQLLRDVVVAHAIPVEQPLDLLRGMEMDLTHQPLRTTGELETYCYHAAGVVGLMMCRVLGVRNPDAFCHAVALGNAMQMTNIARDVREDFERQRSYLPGCPRPDQASETRLAECVEQVLLAADTNYRHGLQGIWLLPKDCQFGIRLAAAFYREIGQEIRRRENRVWPERIVVPKWRLALLAIKIWGQAATTSSLAKSPAGPTVTEETYLLPFAPESKMKDARYIAFLGLSLTCIMATALFLLVYVNPKESSYTWLPLVYSGVSAVLAFTFNLLARAQTKLSTAEL